MNAVESMTLPPPVIGRRGSASKYEREFAAFQKMLPVLAKSHDGQFVAIHDEQVVAHGTDRLQVVSAAFAKVGHVDIHVGFIGSGAEDVCRSGVRRDLSQGMGSGNR